MTSALPCLVSTTGGLLVVGSLFPSRSVCVGVCDLTTILCAECVIGCNVARARVYASLVCVCAGLALCCGGCDCTRMSVCGWAGVRETASGGRGSRCAFSPLTQASRDAVVGVAWGCFIRICMGAVVGWCTSSAFLLTQVRRKFHGSMDPLAIIAHGFNLPLLQRGMFGPGIYFASESDKSRHFALGNHLLLCKVALGRSLVTGQADENLNRSVLQVVSCDGVAWRRVVGPGLAWPGGAARCGGSGGGGGPSTAPRFTGAAEWVGGPGVPRDWGLEERWRDEGWQLQSGWRAVGDGPKRLGWTGVRAAWPQPSRRRCAQRSAGRGVAFGGVAWRGVACCGAVRCGGGAGVGRAPPSVGEPACPSVLVHTRYARGFPLPCTPRPPPPFWIFFLSPAFDPSPTPPQHPFSLCPVVRPAASHCHVPPLLLLLYFAVPP